MLHYITSRLCSLIIFDLNYVKNQRHFNVSNNVCCKSYRIFRKSLLVVTSLTASEEAHFPQLWSLRKKIPMLKISTKAAIAELFLIKLEIRGLQIYEERTGTRMNYLGIILTFLKELVLSTRLPNCFLNVTEKKHHHRSILQNVRAVVI